jgi:hypothetical protein
MFVVPKWTGGCTLGGAEHDPLIAEACYIIAGGVLVFASPLFWRRGRGGACVQLNVYAKAFWGS